MKLLEVLLSAGFGGSARIGGVLVNNTSFLSCDSLYLAVFDIHHIGPINLLPMAKQSQQSGEPGLCPNNCGFFGNPATNNLCSKCYKEHLIKQSKELGNDITSRNDQNEKNKEQLINEFNAGEAQNVNPPPEVGGAGATEGSTSSANPAQQQQQLSNRCSFCKKRVGLTGFQCRCGQVFCSIHRYSDKHSCVFDYKGAAQDAIAKANPVVKADKMRKI